MMESTAIADRTHSAALIMFQPIFPSEEKQLLLNPKASKEIFKQTLQNREHT